MRVYAQAGKYSVQCGPLIIFMRCEYTPEHVSMQPQAIMLKEKDLTRSYNGNTKTISRNKLTCQYISMKQCIQ